MSDLEFFPIAADGSVQDCEAVFCATSGLVLTAAQSVYDKVGFVPPWICYLAVSGGRILGTCGFRRPPVYDEAEITYFTFPGHEGQGVATAMVSMLLDVAETHAPGIRLTAQTLIRRNASHRVLEKVGFVEQKTISNLEDGSVLQWVHVAVEPQDCAGGVGV